MQAGGDLLGDLCQRSAALVPTLLTERAEGDGGRAFYVAGAVANGSPHDTPLRGLGFSVFYSRGVKNPAGFWYKVRASPPHPRDSTTEQTPRVVAQAAGPVLTHTVPPPPPSWQAPPEEFVVECLDLVFVDGAERAVGPVACADVTTEMTETVRE